jgi:PAS domain S-box-containing protein
MLNSTKDSIVLISPTYRVLNFNKVANESAMRLYGKTMQLGDDFLVYLMPEVKETFFDFFAKAMEGEQVSSEFRADVGGRMLWLKYAYLPVYADEGEIIGVSFNIINVNKRREAEEQLKSLLAENQAITKALDNSALVSITDLEGKILKVNQIFCDVSGYTESELVGSDHNIVNSRKHDKAFWRGMWQTIAKGKAWRAEVCNRAKNGDIYWVDTVINPMYDEHGKIHQYLSIRYLATQRKNAEQKLKDSEAYHRSLIKTIPDLVFVIGKNGVFLDFKAASKDLYTKPEDFLGKNIFDVLPQDVAEKLQKALHKTLENSELVEFQYSLEITNELRHFNARVIAFGINKVTAIVTDVTESVNNLKNIQSLLHVKEEQNRRLGNFTHIVSHNLRSHSANLQGLLAMLELETPEIYENEYLRMFRDASDNLSETIHHLNQVLDISNTQDAAWKILNLHEVINANVKNISMLIKEGKISVLNDTPKNVNLHVIPAYLDSIVLNFLTNAVKYRSKERDSFVRFFVEQDGNYTVLKVQDNGLGIDLKKYRSRLFGMYKTFHTHKESKGLGLFITKNQIEAMGGRVEVESEVNIGTTFKIYFLNEKN